MSESAGLLRPGVVGRMVVRLHVGYGLQQRLVVTVVALLLLHSEALSSPGTY